MNSKCEDGITIFLVISIFIVMVCMAIGVDAHTDRLDSIEAQLEATDYDQERPRK